MKQHIAPVGREKTRHEIPVITILVALIAITLLAAMTTGSYATPLEQLISICVDLVTGQGVAQENSQALYVLTVIRIPRLLLSLMAGGSLAVSGAAYQGLLRNPMVSPDILGVSSGASTGAILCLLLGASLWVMQGVAFAFGLGAVAIVLLLGRLIGRGSSKLLVLVLAGVVISSIFSAFTSLIKYIADSNDKLPAIVFWLMGSFARSSNWNSLLVLAVAMALGSVPLMLLRHRMNVLSFGEEEAQTMGVDVRRTRLIIICCATVLRAATVTLCGNIGWVGLILPHLMRLIVGPDYRYLLPSCLLAGGLFMLLVDNTVRLLLPGEMPVGIVTSLIGAPLFIYLLFQGRRDWV
ncbi:MAG: iron ABC transporter permease [Propionibacterium sp.]|jgi:hmuU protein|nr:iron ABC transporter permease [Propionibacterium sp.]